MFYVYQHRRNDTDEVFYVGKGSGKRINCGKKGGTKSRSQFWQNVVKKAGGFKAEKIIDNIDEELAFLIEEEYIDKLKSLGAKLVNLNNGGKGGLSGYKFSQESKDKISKALKGKLGGANHPRYGLYGKDNPMFGRKQSAEARRKMSENACMKRPDMVAKISGSNSKFAKAIEYRGKVFNTIGDLAKHLGLKRSTLGVRLHRDPERYGYNIVSA